MTVTSSELIPYIAIFGPTGGGKSAVALKIAEAFPCEIINCDSVQLYRRFDIGSAKPTVSERQAVEHHLIDHLEWSDSYDASQYASEARAIIAQVHDRGRLPVVVGGSALYFRALFADEFHDLPVQESLRKELKNQNASDLHVRLSSLDELRASQIHPHDHFRLTRALEIILTSGKSFSDTIAQCGATKNFPPAFSIFVEPSREDLAQRIVVRTQKMLAEGLVEEVKCIHEELGCPWNARPMQSIGYKQTGLFIQGQIAQGDLQERIVIATRQYAKKQRKGFRKWKCDVVITNENQFPHVIERLRRHIIR